ncbi:unnamed protein product [Adineta ricciae]|uniref:Oxidoreductase FAD/NAD(P)-binding domain-containing protein n=1 Tax=Adineta ricciae TaxID=249248 RepID=A0A816DIH1_ADIRI|nr:unnamed protein product [Adineta ricciae]
MKESVHYKSSLIHQDNISDNARLARFQFLLIKHALGPLVTQTTPIQWQIQCPPSRLDLIAAGSGITPTYQILNEILKEQTSIVPSNGHVGIKIWLLFANQTERDILLRDEVEQLAASNADRFA